MRIVDLAQALAPECLINEIGIRPGEKIHEVLISEDEARQTVEVGDMFVVQPAHPWWSQQNWSEGTPLPEGFRYSSDTNPHWLSREELKGYAEELL